MTFHHNSSVFIIPIVCSFICLFIAQHSCLWNHCLRCLCHQNASASVSCVILWYWRIWNDIANFLVALRLRWALVASTWSALKNSLMLPRSLLQHFLSPLHISWTTFVHLMASLATSYGSEVLQGDIKCSRVHALAISASTCDVHAVSSPLAYITFMPSRVACH